MENDVETFINDKINYDSSLIKSNKIKEKLNSRSFKRKMN